MIGGSIVGLFREVHDRLDQVQAVADERIEKAKGAVERKIQQQLVEAYRKLVNLTEKTTPDELMKVDAGAMSELFRVVHAYSIFAPTRWNNVHLVPEALNPKKTKEDDLDVDELVPVLATDPQPIARGLIADILSKRAPVGSYRIAAAIVAAIQKETHLEVIRRLEPAFARVTGWKNEGTHLDGRELVEWWQKNEAELKAKDTDAKITHSK